jgi:hypothetical protein
VPKFILPIESWLVRAIEQPAVPSASEIKEKLVLPLLAQIKHDAGETIYQLSHGRLGVDGPPQSVRQQSKQMTVTRARVYQLLEDCSRVMEVRWPEGRHLLTQLDAKLRAAGVPDNDLRLFQATCELLYPGKHRSAEEEPAEDAEDE